MSNAPLNTVAPSPPPWAADATTHPSPTRARHELVIEPAGRWPRIDFAELWEFRQLLFFLVWRDLKVRYAQTVLGIGWAVLQPVLSVLIFTIIFGRFAKVPSNGVPYALFSLAAVVPWTYFSTAFSGASNSLVASSNLITKVYFPRLVVPLAPVLAGIVDLAIGFGVLAVMMVVYRHGPGPAVWIVPILVLLTAMTAAGVGAWLAALNIQYRDVKHLVPFLSQIWMYASPVVYPVTLVPERYRLLYAINPLVGITEGFRVALLGTGALPWQLLGVSTTVVVVLFVSGAMYFRRTERLFADVA
jgi:lipopolysaccharide transport system permease protein